MLAAHPTVAECAVVGAADDFKGEIPVGFLVLKSDTDQPIESVATEVVAMVREKIGPVASFKHVLVVDKLPKTRSGKILRGTIKKIADGSEWKMPATIDDPTAFEDVGDALRTIGLAKQGTPEPVKE